MKGLVITTFRYMYIYIYFFNRYCKKVINIFCDWGSIKSWVFNGSLIDHKIIYSCSADYL